MNHLRAITKARQHKEAADLAYWEAIRDALTAGVPQTKVAPAAGITRMTLYRWSQKGGPHTVAAAGDPTHEAQSHGRDAD